LIRGDRYYCERSEEEVNPNDDCVEIERLRASLIDLHAEYINTLEKNPECSAWDLDEQSIEDQRRLRRNAAHAISIVEPPIYLQADQQVAKIKELETAYLKAQNSNLLRKQEIERLRAALVEHEEHENQTHKVLGNILGTDDTLENVAKRAAVRIKELEAELAEMHNCALEVAGFLAEKENLEAALVEERANKMIQADDCTQNQDAADFHHRCICEYNVKKCPIEQWWLDRARITLQAEGKIGSSDHSSDVTKKVWQITEERKDVIGICLRMLRGEASFFTNRQNRDAALETLRAMLRESEQCKWRCAHQ
jgi:hypothetical protein